MVDASSLSIASRVHARNAGACELLTLPTPVQDFVSFRASFKTHPDFTAKGDPLQDLTVALLDKGTTRRDRFELAKVLEDCGAKLNISSDGLFVDVSGQALTRDFESVLDVLAEMLREPLFDADEFEKAKASTIAELQRDLEQTGTQASGALSRRLFPEAHPNYSPPTETLIDAVQETTLAEVKGYYDAHFGANDFRMAVVGDLEHPDIETTVDRVFGDWEPHTTEASHATTAEPAKPGQSLVPMADKSNVDVRIGQALDLYRDSPEYEALYVANFILGGNFSARLMNIVRDEMGLTYHISSGITGLSTEHHGSWRTVVTLSSDGFEEGVAATRSVIADFIAEGATQDELDTIKTTITGSFVVGLATTSKLARTLLSNAERGFSPDYIDSFPSIIESLTLEEVQDATRQHLDADELHVAAAGTLPETVEA